MVKMQKWQMVKAFDGVVTKENFSLVEEELPSLKDGEFLVEGVCWSVDPYMRPYMRRFPVNSTMIGQSLCKVIESKNKDIKVGSFGLVSKGWTSHAILDKAEDFISADYLGDYPKSLGLGVLGMPGATAYLGFLKICKPKKGETVLVNGAAGAVGSVVGQIAKIKGCKVVAFCGSDAKVRWLKNDLKFDHVFNYKSCDIAKTLKQAAPEGYDCFFDNVGGDFSQEALKQMNRFGRISLCGSISSYNLKADEPAKGELLYWYMIGKELLMQGFIVSTWRSEWLDAFKEIKTWIKEGKLQYKETTRNGFQNMPDAFMGLFTGDNIGKAIVKA